MARSIESIYQDIADAISESIDGPWARAWIKVGMEEDHAEFDFMYEPSPGAKPVSFDDEIEPRSYDVYTYFNELRDVFKSSGKKAWSSAVFTLEESGKFKLDFSYA